MHYVIAGGSGFLGRALRAALARDGHSVTRLVRRPAPIEAARADESPWDPRTGDVDHQVLAEADVVVNLCGTTIGRPHWTASYRRGLHDSRVASTRSLATALARIDEPPAFLAQSAVGYYGEDRGAEILDEDSSPGRGFLADLVAAWEAAAEPAHEAGVRVCHLRTGLVLDRAGGTFPLQALPFRFGMGGRVGSGRQYFPAIGLADWVAAALFLGSAPTARGVFNLTAPEPATNAELTAELGRLLHRPTPLPLPAPMLRLALGGLAAELLGSRRIVPRRLLEAGFTFQTPDISSTLAAALGRADAG